MQGTGWARDRRWALVAALALGVLLLVLCRDFTVDDAFITYRHARNLAAGHGPVMNPGERVEGTSSLPWAAILGLGARLGAEPHVAAPVLSSLLGLVCIVATALVARRVWGSESTAGAAALLCAAGVPLAVWSASGMDTALAALGLLGLFAAWQRAATAPTTAAHRGLGAALGIVAAVRPEGAMFALPVVAERLRRDRGAALVTVAGMLALWLPLVAFRWFYYGDWLPNPARAKSPDGLSMLGPGIAYALQLVVGYPLGFVAVTRVARSAGPGLRLGLLVAMQVGFTIVVGGDHFPGARFLAAVWPLLALALVRLCHVPIRLGRARGAVLALLASAALACAVFPGSALPVATRLAALARLQRPVAEHELRLRAEVRHAGAAGLAVVAWVLVARGAVWFGARAGVVRAAGLAACVVVPAVFDARFAACRRPDGAARYGRPVGEWLHANLPGGTLVATNAAGSVPYWSGLPVVDMLGLTDRHIARRRPDSHQWIGHERGDGIYVLDRRPAIVILGGAEGSLEPWPFRGDQEIAADPRFGRDYVAERVPLAGFEFVFYRLRDAALGLE